MFFLHPYFQLDPHCSQVAYDLHDPVIGPALIHTSLLPTLKLERTLDETFSLRLPSRCRDKDAKSTVYWSQRMCLLAEMDFLCQYGHESSTVVYAGAAPGLHIPLLANYFPRHHFFLYDEQEFSWLIYQDNVSIINELLTDDEAISLGGYIKNPLFISDIRGHAPCAEEHSMIIQDDMTKQMRWHFMMNSVRSLLKFRLPATPGKTRYLDGTLYLCPWGPRTVAETRLVTGDMPNALRD